MAGSNELFYDTVKLGNLGESFTTNGQKLKEIHDDIIAIQGKIAQNWEGDAHAAFDIVMNNFISSIEEVVPAIKDELGAKFYALQETGEETTQKNTNLFNE